MARRLLQRCLERRLCYLHESCWELSVGYKCCTEAITSCKKLANGWSECSGFAYRF